MQSETVSFWQKWLRLEKQINKEKIIFSWLRCSMGEQEIEALKKAVEKYHSDLIVKQSKNGSGTVERISHE